VKKAVLAAIVEEPSHGWEITDRLNRLLAPTWSTDRRRVYDALKDLEADGLAWSEVVRDDEAPNGSKRVFHPTKLGLEVCASWLRGSGSQEQRTLADLYAWMLLARPEEAPDILADLEELAQDCMEKAQESTEVRDATTWRERMVNQREALTREEHRFELRCIKNARREIEEYLADQQ
jgi:DNA-binding PadR family transcriptional regulator